MRSKFIPLLLLFFVSPASLHSQTRSDLSGIAFIVDPGHSANENVGIYGYSEAYKVLDVGFHLREFLRLSNADTVAMTRTDRTTIVNISQRYTFANNLSHPNKWFHSIHSDAASMGSSANSILILISDSCATASGKICQSRWASTTISMGNWQSDLMSRAYRISTRGVYGDRTFGYQFGTSYGSGGVGVLRETAMPATLSEGGFHTNPRQNLLNLNSESKRTEAKAIWFSMLGHFGAPRPTVRTLLGVVSDIESNAPVNGATVTIGSKTYKTNTYEDTFKPYAGSDTTLGNGFYYFEDLPAGAQSITISAPGYIDTTLQASVIDSFFTFQDVKITSKLPPRLTSSYPAQNAIDILPNASLTLTFSRPIIRSSAESNIYLLDPVEVRVAGTFSWSNGDKTISFKPAATLLMDTTYKLVIGAEVRDVYNHRFDGNKDGVEGDSLTITFRTKSADITPPTVFRVFPPANAIVSSPNHVINVTFNEPLDSTTVNNNNIAIQVIGGSLLPRTLQYSQANGRGAINVYLPNGFTAGKSYRIRISGVADIHGNAIPLTSPLIWEFSVANVVYEYTTIESFNSGISDWWQPGQSSTTGVDGASLTHAPSFFLPTLSSNTGSALLRFSWRTTASDWLLREYLGGGSPRSVLWRKEKTRLQTYIYGDGSSTLFRFAVDDSVDVFPNNTPNHEVNKWTTIDWVGWKLVEWDLENDPVGSWVGNGKLEGTLRFDSFQLKYEPGSSTASGELYIDQLMIAKGIPTSVEPIPGNVPTSMALHQNYPNPFNPTTTIEFSVGAYSYISLRVFDMLGREVAVLANEERAPGIYKVTWDGSALPSGVYLYRMQAGNFVETRKLTLIK